MFLCLDRGVPCQLAQDGVSPADFKDRGAAWVPDASIAKFGSAAKYFGVFVDPDVARMQRCEAVVKMKASARVLKQLAFGLEATLHWYNSADATVASHIGQLVAPGTS